MQTLPEAPLAFLKMEGHTPEAKAEVIDLYEELERRFGEGYAQQIIKRYTGE